MTDDKPRPPHWLNPDAVLGAVQTTKGVLYFVVAIHIGVRKGCPTLSLVDPVYRAPASVTKYLSVVKLRPDLWPVKRELAALFGEGGE